MKIKTLTLSLFIGLYGCSAFEQSNNALTVLSAATDIKYYYETEDPVQYIENANLSSDEIDTLTSAMARVETAKSLLQLIGDDPKRLVLELDRVKYEYIKIKKEYLKVKGIAQTHFDEYTIEEQSVLMKFDGAAQILDVQFTDLINSANAMAAMKTAVRLSETVVKIVALL